MKPYLVIIRDSFHEALASRVLWILLILITLFLLALAPLGYRSEQTAEFRHADFVDARELVKVIRGEFTKEKSSPGFRIWSRFDEKARERLTEFGRAESGRSQAYYKHVGSLVDALNKLLESKDLYNEDAWKDVLLGSEARDLLAKGPDRLAKAELARLNRLLIEKPYPEQFRPQPAQQIVLTYFSAGISPPLRFSEQRVKQVIEKVILPAIMGLLVGTIAVFAGILVTAPIIPHMFDPGSLSLLLSKPLSRSWMFLAKFVGGCAFILINVTLLNVGLWVIAGLRFGIWNQGLLLCIPIFLFLFAIYYAISSLTGVIWRNTVVCVVMTILFWVLCTAVGTAKAIFEQFAVETRRIVDLVEAGDTLITVDEQGATHRWDSKKNEWESVFVEETRGPMGGLLGPVYDADKNLLLAAQVWNRGLFGGNATLQIGKGSDGWMLVDGPALPDGTYELLPDPQGRLLAVTNKGVQRLSGDLDLNAKKLKVFFMEIPQNFAKPFSSAGPVPPLTTSPPAAAAVDAQTANVVIYSRGSLMLLERKGKNYELRKTVDVEAEKDDGASVAIGGSTVLLALLDGRILDFDATTLKLRRTFQPEEHSQPRFLNASPDGHWFAAVFHNGNLRLLDTSKDSNARWQSPDVVGQGDVSAAVFPAADRMLVADRATRVTQYQLGSWARAKSFAPSLTPLEMVYYYVVTPIYTIFPKPGELDNTVLYVLKGEETTGMGFQRSNLEAKRVRLRPWAPVTSSLVFMLIVLALACIYIERQDF